MNPFKPKIIGDNYLKRWHIIPRNRFFNIYLHKFTGNDDSRALHDHPWRSLSIRLKGELWETYQDPLNIFGHIWRKAPKVCYRPAEFAHRLELVDKTKPVWTIFITGSVVRDWYFHCSKGKVPWQEMTTPEGKQIGGCE